MYVVVVSEPADDRQDYSTPDIHGPFPNESDAKTYAKKLKAKLVDPMHRPNLEIDVEPLIAPEIDK